MKYNFKKIEKKWQKKWAEKKIFEVKENSKKKFYVLEMYPYPSSSGLHMGHAFNYIIGDILARFKRMSGFNVLYPMGYDSFGLPAENAAIKVGKHPKETTNKAIKNYIKQQKELGLSYDWSRLLMSHDEDYYKWNQYFFLKFLEKGLVYRKKSAVNWCPKCNTVLANEQVQGGKCWRHGDIDVETKNLEQWFIKTTAYADELLNCVDNLQWPERIKAMQKNWIGKSHGTEIDFEIEIPTEISNVVIVHGSNSTEEGSKSEEKGPENLRHWKAWLQWNLEELNIKVSNEFYPKDWSPIYNEWKNQFEKNEINENSILVGHSAGGAFLVRWLGETKRKIKKLILVSPGKTGKQSRDSLSNLYGDKITKNINQYIKEGIIIFTSDNDIKNHIEGAREYEKELSAKVIFLKNHGHFTLGDMGAKEFPELLDEILSSSGNQKFPIFTTRPDTIYGVTFMVISAQHPQLMELVTDEQKKDVEKFLKKIKSTSEKDIEELEKEGVFTGSYAINPLTKEKVPIWAGNFVVADYGSGMVMAVPAHDQRDFEFAKKYGLEVKQVIKGGDIKEKEYISDGVLINSEQFNGLDNKKAKEKITKYLEHCSVYPKTQNEGAKKLGRKKIQFKLRDWLISRQRYWGTPIPVVYCDKCGIVPVDEKDLPVKLPMNVKFGKGNPLETNEKFVNTKCPKCNGKARRETDTMDTFFDSSWYYLRYCDNENKKEPFDKKKVGYWMPVDQYIGGAEHACMHLLYARFFTKALRDLGFVKFDEPFVKLFNQGMLHGDDGDKMSKSKGNVVLPEEVSNKYGIDTARLFLMSIASPDKDLNWNEKGIEGSSKFVKKIINYFEDVKITNADVRSSAYTKEVRVSPVGTRHLRQVGLKEGPKLLNEKAKTESKLNKAIKDVSDYIGDFKYNLAIIRLRDLFNSLPEETSKDVLEKSLKILHPFCPHITEELWEKIGGKGFISLEKWPVSDEKKINEKFEKQEQAVEKLKSDIEQIKKLTGKKSSKIYVYVLPNELELYSGVKEIKIFAVNDKEKYDPENKSKKTKPGKPAIYLE